MLNVVVSGASRRLVLSGALVLGAAGLSTGAWQTAAGASSAGVPIQYQNGNCGYSTGAPFIGTVYFQRVGNTMSVTYDLTGGTPDTTYDVSLWNGAPCSEIADLGPLTTNGAGHGEKTFKTRVKSRQSEFFATGYANGSYNDSLIASE